MQHNCPPTAGSFGIIKERKKREVFEGKLSTIRWKITDISNSIRTFEIHTTKNTMPDTKEQIENEVDKIKTTQKNSNAKKKTTKKKTAAKVAPKRGTPPVSSNYPRHSVEKSLRIAKAILEQNAGKECSEAESAKFVGVNPSGPFGVEISSAIKYGFLERTGPGRIKPTELVKKILRPQSPDDEINGFQEAVLNAPIISNVYKHFRGENLPDRKFFENALTDNFKIPTEKVSEFIDIFTESLSTAKLIEKFGDKYRIVDISSEISKSLVDSTNEIKKLGKSLNITSTDSCFVVMPFGPPLGDYYKKIYEPAIQKAGLNPVRADNEIFGTGKIIDQIWSGINNAKVLIAELTDRNANVFYELGLAHALKKPVVLISSNDKDVPFDLQHIRVIYYDVFDPFWGNKLIDKVAENILSEIKNPEEAILFK